MKRRTVLAFVVLLAATPTILNHFALWRVERALDLKIQERPLMSLMPGKIHLGHASIEWEAYFKVVSGELDIRYGVLELFTGAIPVSLDGKELEVTFGDRLTKLLGAKYSVLDKVHADVVISGQGKIRIESLALDSDTIQFNLSGQS